MAKINFKKELSTPSTPPAGYVSFYPEGTNLKYVDDTGTSYTLAVGVIPTTEDIQDIVGGLLIDSSTVDVTYNDAGNTLSLTVIASAVNHNALLNYVANEHVNHSTVSINAGTGLTGGGDITATRSISMPAVGTAGTYGSATQVPVITTDAQGRVSSVTNTSINVPATISYNRVASVSLSTTTSTTYVVLDTLTITPVAGTYLVHARATVSATSNSRTLGFAVHTDSTIVTDSETSGFIRTGSGFGTNTDIETLVTDAIVTVNGSQAINARWKTNGGTVQAQGYSIVLIRLV